MSYSRTNWANGATALSAENMNNIEDGINEALTNANGNATMWAYISNLVYPVGSIYMSATLSTKAAVETALGGTWEAWGSGKVPVGVNTSDSSFNTVEKTGGSKDAIIPKHHHSASFVGTPVAGHTHTVSGTAATNGAHTHSVSGTAVSAGKHSHTSKTRSNTAASGSDIRTGPWTQSTIYADQVNINTSEAGAHTHDVTGTAASGGSHYHNVSGSAASAGGHTPAGSVTVNDNGVSVTNKNLQPYITVYMWKRTA